MKGILIRRNVGIVTDVMTPISPFSIITATINEGGEKGVVLSNCCRTSQTLEDEIRVAGSSGLIDVRRNEL